MLGFERNAARAVWTACLVLLLLWLTYVLRTTLFIFAVAILLAYLLAPLVNLLDRFLPASRSRTPALAAAYLIFVGLLVLIGSQIGSQVVSQANALANNLPGMLARWQAAPPKPGGLAESLQDQIFERVRGELTRHSSDFVAALPKAAMRTLAVASDLIYVVIVPVLAFFFLKDGHLIRVHLLGLVADGERRLLLDDTLQDIHILLAKYMRALVLLSFATFVAYSIGFTIIGVPYGLLLATLAMLLEFIPMLGPLAAAAAALLVAAIGGGSVVPVLLFVLAFRMFQDYVLSPYLMGQGIELHPLMVLFGVFAGAELAGIPGTFLSVPILALARILYIRVAKARAAARLQA